jgi:hypothetical protein
MAPVHSPPYGTLEQMARTFAGAIRKQDLPQTQEFADAIAGLIVSAAPVETAPTHLKAFFGEKQRLSTLSDCVGKFARERYEGLEMDPNKRSDFECGVVPAATNENEVHTSVAKFGVAMPRHVLIISVDWENDGAKYRSSLYINHGISRLAQ